MPAIGVRVLRHPDRLLAMSVPASMTDRQPNNPLHGVTLEVIVMRLVERYGWAELGRMIPIKCFTSDPSVKSSLKFLRKTPWARTKVEALYVRTLAPRSPGGRCC